MSKVHIRVTLNVWRQACPGEPGRFVAYAAEDVNPDMSFFELLDVINEGLIRKGEEPIAFDHDCREGICGCCGIVINGRPHGPKERTTSCQLHMRSFKNGDVLTVEPFRAIGFPILKDLIVDRRAMDRIISAGGFITAPTGSAVDANTHLVPKENAELAFDAAACIGCGACVAACPNASAMLFVAAKVSHLGLLPQGQPERSQRVQAMVARMDAEDFGTCSNHGECEAACPKGVSLENIARLNRDFIWASLNRRSGG